MERILMMPEADTTVLALLIIKYTNYYVTTVMIDTVDQ